MKTHRQEISVDGQTIILETGLFAQQSNGAVLARSGDTVVLATVVSAVLKEEFDFFPLKVDYLEHLYAGGRIKGSRWVKRDGRPSDEAILTSRLIDRSVRPLFPKAYSDEVQIIVTVLSVDNENNPDILAVCATSAALAISDIPWQGPVGGLRVGMIEKDGQKTFLANPLNSQLPKSQLNLLVSGTEESLIMLEGDADFASEKDLIAALEFAQEKIKTICQGIKDFTAQAGLKKQTFAAKEIDPQLVSGVYKKHADQLKEVVTAVAIKKAPQSALSEVAKSLYEEYPDKSPKEIDQVLDKLVTKIIREVVLETNRRIDGRSLEEIRPLTIQVGVLPRTHGSAMFKRGMTQALTIATLGASSLGQLIENMEGEETKRYIHHYNMPPFSSGETGRIGSPGRREIGHGALAEKALLPVIPSEAEFPYAIQVVSEIMSSNGSTSMASVCGSTLSLMDAGVPLKEPVAGIAMGLISDGEKHLVLSDIMGFEDFCGDMDFKIAGTKKGITAIQMDVKNTQIPFDIFTQAFEQARQGRLFILEKMLSVLAAPRPSVSQFAPKIHVIHISPEKIGEVIGPGGRRIKSIISDTGAEVDIEDDGSVSISAVDKAAVDKAEAMITGIVREIEVGEIFEGTIVRLEPFGAFVELAPGRDGLVHVSRLSGNFVKDPSEVVSMGQKVSVQVIEIDDRKRINLAMLDENGQPFGSGPESRPSRSSRPPQRGFREQRFRR